MAHVSFFVFFSADEQRVFCELSSVCEDAILSAIIVSCSCSDRNDGHIGYYLFHALLGGGTRHGISDMWPWRFSHIQTFKNRAENRQRLERF